MNDRKYDSSCLLTSLLVGDFQNYRHLIYVTECTKLSTESYRQPESQYIKVNIMNYTVHFLDQHMQHINNYHTKTQNIHTTTIINNADLALLQASVNWLHVMEICQQKNCTSRDLIQQHIKFYVQCFHTENYFSLTLKVFSHQFTTQHDFLSLQLKSLYKSQ